MLLKLDIQQVKCFICILQEKEIKSSNSYKRSSNGTNTLLEQRTYYLASLCKFPLQNSSYAFKMLDGR